MIPLRWVISGGNQENTTCLSTATAPNISGEPAGTKDRDYIINIKVLLRNERLFSFLSSLHIIPASKVEWFIVFG